MMDWQMTALLKLISSVLDETSHAVRGPSVICHAAVYEQVPVGCDESSWNGPAPRLPRVDDGAKGQREQRERGLWHACPLASLGNEGKRPRVERPENQQQDDLSLIHI